MEPITTSCITNFSQGTILVHSAIFLVGAMFGACVSIVVVAVSVVAKRADEAIKKGFGVQGSGKKERSEFGVQQKTGEKLVDFR